MRKLKLSTFILLLIVTPKIFCQPAIKSIYPGTIKVRGQSTLEVEPSSYVVEIDITESYSPSRNSEFQVVDIYLDSIEMILHEKLIEIGFAPGSLSFAYIRFANNTSGNNSNAIENLGSEVFNFPLKSYEELTKLLKVLRFKGLQDLRVRKIFDFDSTEIQNRLYSIAAKDAKIKIENILTSINLKPGNILNITFIDPIESPFHMPIITCCDARTEFDRLNELKRTKTLSTVYEVTYEIIQ